MLRRIVALLDDFRSVIVNNRRRGHATGISQIYSERSDEDTKFQVMSLKHMVKLLPDRKV